MRSTKVDDLKKFLFELVVIIQRDLDLYSILSIKGVFVNMKENREYFIGLDIGTDSVGYAVTDEGYNLIKYKGEPMWGAHLFDPAKQSAERRGFRTARRRLDRRQQRVCMIDEIFAPEVAKVDEHFYIRKKEAALYRDDSTYSDEEFLYFNNTNYTDKDYHREFPTIHHLICELMNNKDRVFDIRLINIAVDWMVAHRGHFLNDIGLENINKVKEFDSTYEVFMDYFDINGIDKPWDAIDVDAFSTILKMRGVNNKKNEFKKLLYQNSIPSEEYFIDRKELIAFLSGGKVKASKLFKDFEGEEDLSISISDDMEEVLGKLGDYSELVARMAAMYDWSLLSDILGESESISEAKVRQYDQHKKDLRDLKRFVRKYVPKKYNEIFKIASDKIANYTKYSYNVTSVQKRDDLPKRKADKDDFYAYLKKTIQFDSIKVSSKEDEAYIEDVKNRMDEGTYMPKQVNTDNRVIPYQLYYYELKKIIENATKHYSFLLDKDSDGYTNIDKIESIFTYRIPYYVGPLRTDNGRYGWMVRKAEGKIYPWNFEDKVNLEESENAFIDRMTNMCTYLPGESVIPKYSLLYSKYTVLNEINNIKSNEKKLSVEAKQGIYNDLFCKYAKVTPKRIREYLVSRGYIEKDDSITGIDENINASLKSRYDFKRILDNGILSEDDVERIISRSTYSEDKSRYKKWIKKEYSKLSDEDYKYIAKLKYKDFGRLSKKLLCGIEGADTDTGEKGTIMHFLWETNDNLMQILSDKYTFMEQINAIRRDYYAQNPKSISDIMDEMGISNAVKRPVKRTLAVVDDVVSTMKYPPKKIFVEMARGADDVKKRSTSRKDQILNLYKTVVEDTRELERQLEDMGEYANNNLQSDALFLYYMQLGKCMYSGKPIDITQLKTTKYNIDHIYPQSLVKDDSVLNNKVLVLSEINGDKKDVYPIDSSIRSNMHSMWKMMVDNGLITKEKYARLVRSTPFTEDEKYGFINRQLVETRQSMKAVTQLLNNLYPDTEIVYVKARLASDFRHAFDLTPKSRLINDLHHAKDAYLNVVVGNVYNERFTKKWFHINDKYTLNTEKLFTKELKHGENVIWNPDIDLPKVKKTYDKNNIHLTRYAYCSKGGLFDQNPVKAGQGQVAMKEGMDIAKYGGYNKAAASFFVVAKYKLGGKTEISFVPVELRVKDIFIKDKHFATEYITNILTGLNTKKIEDVDILFDNRIIKIKSVISIDGYEVWVNGKANGGKIVILSSAENAIFSSEYTRYIKNIENYIEKKKNNKNILHDSQFDKLSETDNIKLYDAILEKLNSSKYCSIMKNQKVIFEDGRKMFVSLDFDKQIMVLMEGIKLLKSGRAGGCDLSEIGGKGKSGVMFMSSKISSERSIKLIDYSPAGLHRRESIDLRELLV